MASVGRNAGRGEITVSDRFYTGASPLSMGLIVPCRDSYKRNKSGVTHMSFVRKRLAAVAAIVIVITATVATTETSAAAKPSPRAALRAYLARMRVTGAQASLGLNFTDTGLYFAKSATDITNGSRGDSRDAVQMLSKATQHLQLALTNLQDVKPPEGLSGPQSSLKSGLRLAMRSDDSLSTALEKGDPVNGGVAYATTAGKFADAEDRVGEWRDELIVQLRRQAVTVPLWVKRLGHELTPESQP